MPDSDERLNELVACPFCGAAMVLTIDMGRVEVGVGGPRPYYSCPNWDEAHKAAEMAAMQSMTTSTSGESGLEARLRAEIASLRSSIDVVARQRDWAFEVVSAAQMWQKKRRARASALVGHAKAVEGFAEQLESVRNADAAFNGAEMGIVAALERYEANS